MIVCAIVGSVVVVTSGIAVYVAANHISKICFDDLDEVFEEIFGLSAKAVSDEKAEQHEDSHAS